ncbi:MAG: cache domain-containing protein, partial [Spirochaetales bacterium]|nr:cache domain-containing protein [Spirochaetales bacterium]
MKGIHSSRPFTTIASRLIFGFVSIVLLPAIIISSVSVVSSLRHSRKQLLNQLESVATLKEAEIETWLDSLNLFLPVLTAGPRIEAKLNILLAQEQEYKDIKKDVRERFRLMIEYSQLFETVFLVNTEGLVVFSTEWTQEGHVLRNQTFFEQGLKEAYIHPPAYSLSLQQMIVTVARP